MRSTPSASGHSDGAVQPLFRCQTTDDPTLLAALTLRLGLCRVPKSGQFTNLHRLIAMGVYEASQEMDRWVVEVLSWGAGE